MWAIPADPRDPIDCERLEPSSKKMSKSKSNGVDPAVVIDRSLRADTARMFHPVQGRHRKDLELDERDVEGAVPLPAATVAAGGNC